MDSKFDTSSFDNSLSEFLGIDLSKYSFPKIKSLKFNFPKINSSKIDTSELIKCIEKIEDDPIFKHIIIESYYNLIKTIRFSSPLYRRLTGFTKEVCYAIVNWKIVVDDDYVMIPRSIFDENWIRFYQKYANSQSQKEKKKESERGRKPIRRLFEKITDNQVINYFKETFSTVRETCLEYFENIKQFCVCFYNGAFKAFSPYEDPYGKLSHYHKVIRGVIEGIPTRKTLNNGYNWYITWRKSAIITAKEIADEKRHKLWETLIGWIYLFLQRLAPQYVVAQ